MCYLRMLLSKVWGLDSCIDNIGKLLLVLLKKAPHIAGLFLGHFTYLYFGGSRNAIAKNNVPSAKARISV